MSKRARHDAVDRNKENKRKLTSHNKNTRKRAVSRNTAPSEKNNRKRRIVLKILKWTTLLALIIGATIFLLTTPIFNVEEIEVSGNEHVTSEEIISLSQIIIGENTFKNSKSTIEANIKQNAYIDSVEIKRIFPNKISITVEERTVKFMAKILNSYAYISSQGYILEISEQPQDVPILEGLSTSEEELTTGDRLNVEDLQKLETVLKIVSSCEENEIYEYISSIDIEDEDDYKLNMEEKSKTAYIGDASNLTTRILYVKAIMEAEEGNPGEIFVNGDLNDGFKAFFRERV